MTFVDIASARLCPAVLFEIFHYQNDSVNNNTAPVGAAIGRPPVKIRSDVKKSAGAKQTIAIVTGRAGAKTTPAVFNPNCPSGEERTSNARPYG